MEESIPTIPLSTVGDTDRIWKITEGEEGTSFEFRKRKGRDGNRWFFLDGPSIRGGLESCRLRSDRDGLDEMFRLGKTSDVDTRPIFLLTRQTTLFVRKRRPSQCRIAFLPMNISIVVSRDEYPGMDSHE